jgi:hypothetical protein
VGLAAEDLFERVGVRLRIAAADGCCRAPRKPEVLGRNLEFPQRR